MAFSRVCYNPVDLRRFRPGFHALPQSPRLIKKSLGYQSRTHGFPTIFACQTTPNPGETETTVEETVVETGSISNSTCSSQVGLSNDAGVSEFPNKETNKRIAVASILASVGLFLFTRLDFGVSLKNLSTAALPYEEAIRNGKPTVVQSYADWCEVCRELAPDVYKVEQQYKDRVNFVMLNVDNTKWEQELDEFGVEGIPHFAFLDRYGNKEGNVVDRLPKQYFLKNVYALAHGEASIPHAHVVGQYLSAETRKVHQVVDSRSHG